MQDFIPVLTIDGPAGSGKGTVAKGIAKVFDWHLLDSGALYRITAHAASLRNIELSDESALVAMIEELDIEFDIKSDWVDVVLDGKDITSYIRLETCGELASKVAQIESVRAALLSRQRDFKQHPGLVADGRDMGTVVFPNAFLKIYLTASAEERANRRHKQLKEQGNDVTVRALIDEISKRDHRDMNRKVAPLKPAEDAVIIETDNVTANEVIELVSKVVKERLSS